MPLYALPRLGIQETLGKNYRSSSYLQTSFSFVFSLYSFYLTSSFETCCIEHASCIMPFFCILFRIHWGILHLYLFFYQVYIIFICNVSVHDFIIPLFNYILVESFNTMASLSEVSIVTLKWLTSILRQYTF